METFVYHDGPDRMELSNGLGIISRGVPFEVPEELAHGFKDRPEFEKVDPEIEKEEPIEQLGKRSKS